MWYALDKYVHSLRYYLEQFHGYKPDDSTTITPTGTIVMDAIDTVDNTIDIAMDTTIDTAMDTSTSGKEKEESNTCHTATTTADATEPSDAKCETESVATPEPPVADATPAKSTRVEKAHVSDSPSSASPRMRRRKAAIAAAAAISITVATPTRASSAASASSSPTPTRAAADSAAAVASSSPTPSRAASTPSSSLVVRTSAESSPSALTDETRPDHPCISTNSSANTDAAKLSPAPTCAEIPQLSTDDTAAQSPAAAAAAASSGDGNSSQGGKPPPSPPSCPLSDMACLSSYEIDGLRRLLAELSVSTTMVRACPEELGDPGELMSTVENLRVSPAPIPDNIVEIVAVETEIVCKSSAATASPRKTASISSRDDHIEV
ncbi:uncharacterized protein LOC135814341 [Sycon ciliatum]|uniref:uncharacterized protein LOC135814341 n=1 Tax=Sycon ciliatum TaxID=27933 RepID=UPI0031F71504